MKKLALSIAFISAAGLAVAQEPKTPEASKPATTHKAAKPASHSVKGEVVSVDAEKHTISFKNDKGEDLTWPAEGTAQTSLKSLKPGEKVTITYRVNEKGEPQAATKIAAVKTHTATSKPAQK
jgi:Cu/Ag efflux protein CusF